MGTFEVYMNHCLSMLPMQLSRQVWMILLQLLISISAEGRTLARAAYNSPQLQAMKAVMLQWSLISLMASLTGSLQQLPWKLLKNLLLRTAHRQINQLLRVPQQEKKMLHRSSSSQKSLRGRSNRRRRPARLLCLSPSWWQWSHRTTKLWWKSGTLDRW